MGITSVDDDVRDIKGVLARLEPAISRIDERVKSLDERFGKLDDRARAIEVEVAEMKGRISQLPTMIQVIGFALVVLAAGGFLRYLGH